MVNYQTHLHVQHSSYETFIPWLRESYIPELLNQAGFLSVELLLKKGGSMESSGKEVKIVCRIQDEEALKVYLNEKALSLRQKAIDAFPGQFSSNREIWLDSTLISDL